MSDVNVLFKEIQDITTTLIRQGLSDRQNYPAIRNAPNGHVVLTASGVVAAGLGFGRKQYRDTYREISDSNAYNIRLLDGGLLLLQYIFEGDRLLKHRLTYWASPDLESFQKEPELYETDENYLDFLEPSIVPIPIRFDFDADSSANEPIAHPRCHMTLGQYLNCRVPVCSPLRPTVFVDFVLRHFYAIAHKRVSSELPRTDELYSLTLYDEEQALPHMVVAARRK